MTNGTSAPDDQARVRSAAAHEQPKHGRLLRSGRDGKVLSAVMRPFYVFATPPGHAVLTTVGRKTGRARQKCIRAIRRGDKAFIVMLRPPHLAMQRPDVVAGWLWNIRANPRVRIRLGRTTYAGRAREITDPAEIAEARTAICETVHLVDYGECDLHLRGWPTRSKIVELHRYWFDTGIPVAVDLSEI